MNLKKELKIVQKKILFRIIGIFPQDLLEEYAQEVLEMYDRDTWIDMESENSSFRKRSF